MRALIAVLAIVGVVALGVFGPRWLMSDAEGQADQGALTCDLLNDTCQWTQKGTRWEAELEKAEDKPDGRVYQLSVKTDMNLPRLLAVLRGESMYMGEYPVPMTRAGAADDGNGALWEARFTAPVCTTDPEMTWRVDLQSGMEQEFDMPVKLIFEAKGRA